MKSVFISTSLRTTDDLDWSSPLKNYLAKIYGNTTDFTREASVINKLRLDVTNAITQASSDTRVQNIFYRYYGQLELLDLRLPVQQHGVRVKFKWYDAYKTSVYHSQHSLAFEKASVLFNLGAVLANIAAETFTELDFKSSYQYFQYSAGVYKFMAENFLHAPSQDLNSKTSLFLEELQLSQAQEVFLLKLVSEDPLKQSLIAKLSSSTASHYTQALQALEKVDIDFGDHTKWKHALEFKQLFYKNLAYFNYALSIQEKKIGEAIAFLKVALEGLSGLKKITNDTTIDYKVYLAETEEKLKLLIKDNDFIYNATIPSKESLDLEGSIKPLDAAKAIPIKNHANINDVVGEDIFEKIIPSNVHEKLSFYSEEKAKLLREQIEKVETTDIELTSFLEYLRLPSSLNDFRNSSQHKLDPKLIDYSNQISNSNLSDIAANKSSINSKKQKIITSIQNLVQALDAEQEDYEQFRSRGLQQEPSSVEASANLRDDLAGAKKSLTSATDLDNLINEKIDAELKNLNILKSKTALESDFFETKSESLLDLDDSSDRKITKYVDEIEKLLKELNDLKAERFNIIKDLKIAIQDDDISNILVLNTKNLSEKDEKTLFDKELKKFDRYLASINSNHTSQEASIDKVKINYNQIILSNTKVTQTVQKVSRYELTYKIFKEYEANFQKSNTFYTNLLNYVEEVKSNINRFVSDRSSQRKRLNELSSNAAADDLQKRFNKFSVSSQSPRGSVANSQGAPFQTPIWEQQQRQSSYSSAGSYQQPSYNGNRPQYAPPALSESQNQAYYPQSSSSTTPNQQPTPFGYESPQPPSQFIQGSSSFSAPSPSQLPSQNQQQAQSFLQPKQQPEQLPPPQQQQSQQQPNYYQPVPPSQSTGYAIPTSNQNYNLGTQQYQVPQSYGYPGSFNSQTNPQQYQPLHPSASGIQSLPPHYPQNQQQPPPQQQHQEQGQNSQSYAGQKPGSVSYTTPYDPSRPYP